MFGIHISKKDEKEEKIKTIDIPLIKEIALVRKNMLDLLPVSVWTFGKIPENPVVSIIIPIYKEYVFVANQMLEFERDSWLINNSEIIYVIDDPNIVDSFLLEIELLYKLFEIPIKIIYGYANRGFALSNNLGAKYSQGNYLIFMNSDVIPYNPEWAKSLIEFLEKNKDAGAVAPLLIFPNGSIQHIGMKLIYLSNYQSFFNHHLYMGLKSEEIVKRKDPIEVEMLTGALFCIKKDLFEKIGGFSEEYLVGDFEDSDISLKIRNEKKKLYVIPSVKLYHLEGGSQGFSQERFKFTLCNSYMLKFKFNLKENENV